MVRKGLQIDEEKNKGLVSLLRDCSYVRFPRGASTYRSQCCRATLKIVRCTTSGNRTLQQKICSTQQHTQKIRSVNYSVVHRILLRIEIKNARRSAAFSLQMEVSRKALSQTYLLVKMLFMHVACTSIGLFWAFNLIWSHHPSQCCMAAEITDCRLSVATLHKALSYEWGARWSRLASGPESFEPNRFLTNEYSHLRIVCGLGGIPIGGIRDFWMQSPNHNVVNGQLCAAPPMCSLHGLTRISQLLRQTTYFSRKGLWLASAATISSAPALYRTMQYKFLQKYPSRYTHPSAVA